ncbi:MAG: helix-turn-helix domain-containing protein [Cytophagaceae bacterium]|nr:MAG: helix-turn-helix domain-containing protein [Cytophagaceae bacterium]
MPHSGAFNTLATFFEQLFLILTYAGIAQGLFVALLLNNKSVRTSRANLFLSILLLTMSFTVLHIMFAGRVVSHFSIKSYALGDPTFFLIAPLLWFYAQALMGHSPGWSVRSVVHFVPFGATVFFSLLLKNLPVSVADSAGYGQWRAILFWLFMLLQFSAYLFLINRRWRSYQQQIEQEVSNTEYVSIAWVRFFMGIFLGINLFFLLILVNLIHHQNIDWANQAIAVLFSLSIFALGYKGILQKEIFQINAASPPSDSPELPLETIARQPDQQLIDRLLQFMVDEKPYLDPELTLSSLASRLSISRSLLSQLINEDVGDNFYNFVNKYRVEQVKAFMTDPAMKHFNLLGLALEAGFKSKSTFNLIFKRFTGLTPSEYLQTVLK